LRQRPLRLLVSFAGVAIVTFVGYRVIQVNATTIGFAYLLLVLVIASSWGFLEASLSSVLATLVFNFFFLPPVGTFTIADPQNWVALFSFLATSLIASRLSAEAKRRALDAGRLYTFSRAILLIDRTEPFAKQLVGKLAEVFKLRAAVLYECHANEFYRAGGSSLEDLDDQLRDAGLHGKVFSATQPNRFIVGVRSGSEPIGSLALEGGQMPDSVLQGIANLVAIGLERARAADLAEQIEAARQSEQLRTTLIDAMAHEFKTPLTLIKAATTSLLASPDEPAESRTEQLTIADEEAEHLRELIDNAVEMARLDSTHIDVHWEISSVPEIVNEVVGSMRTEIDKRPFDVLCDDRVPAITLDRRLIKLAIKQLVDNALKYSPPDTPVAIRVLAGDGTVTMDITDHGEGIPVEEQQRIFVRFYRSPSVKHQVPGSGLGLTIACSIMKAHNGNLTVESSPGETTFRMILPANGIGDEGERGSYSDRR
jgi:two-component system, OmpR family, sensor histidine kinase KdpD